MKRLDATRYTTNGINGLMAGNDRMGEIMCQATGMTPEQLEAMQQPDEQNRGGADESMGWLRLWWDRWQMRLPPVRFWKNDRRICCGK